MLIILLFISLAAVNLLSCKSVWYHNSAHSLFSSILHLDCYFPSSSLINNLALLKGRSSGKDVSKLSHWIIWIKVEFTNVKLLKSIADTTLCYQSQKLLCVDTWEIVVAKIEILETGWFVADDFCQHFDCSFFIIFTFFKPWRIRC